MQKQGLGVLDPVAFRDLSPRAMSFPVKVSGETRPLSLHELCRTLQLATSSPDSAQRQSAGQQLSSWESHDDYYPSLQV